MDISSAGRAGFAPLPTIQDMAAVMAARPSMAEMSSRAAIQASAQADTATDATRSASATDLYL